jgi:F-type H+-transporting ATPase subunit delta
LSEHHNHLNGETFVGALVAGDEAILSRRYIDALYALAKEEDLIDVVATDLRGLRQVWAESAEWRFIASDPRLGPEELANAVGQVTRVCDLEELTSHFLSVVAQNRRLYLLPTLIEAYLNQAASERGEFRADVRTARALTIAQRDALSAALTIAAGGKVHLTVTEDASLLGGLTVKMGSKFIDASVKNKLDQLERNLIADAVA